jgi:hypothetical protein
MLTTDHANRIAAVNTAASVAALLGELLENREPDARLSLSAKSAQGLCEILTFLGDTMEDAGIGLASARNDLASAVQTAREAPAVTDAAFRRGYAQGFAAGHDAPVGEGDSEKAAAMRQGARIAFGFGWRAARGDKDPFDVGLRDEIVDAMVESVREEEADDMRVPSLTESIPEGDGESYGGHSRHDEQRVSA